MGLRPTKKNEGAMDWCREVNDLDHAFPRAVLEQLSTFREAPATQSSGTGLPAASRPG